MFEKLKTKWGLRSNFQVLKVCLVFTLAGSSIGFVRKIVWALFGFTHDTSLWIRVPTYIAFIFPTYQTMLMIFGTLFGEFRFFWDKEKKMFRAIGRMLRILPPAPVANDGKPAA
ncbi:MAG: DUF6787 family protein [Kiritimatiellia bacterium]